MRFKAGSALASRSNSMPVQPEAVVSLAELLPGRLLMLVEVVDVVEFIRQIEQWRSIFQETLDELGGFVGRQEA